MQNIVDEDVSKALAAGSEALLELLEHRLKNAPGYDLFTILTPHPDGRFLARVYSTNQTQYPLGDADPVEDNVWFSRLFADKEPIIANTLEEIGAWLPDYQIFIAQNYASLLNLPVVFDGETIGLINMMGAEHHFDSNAMALIMRELPLAALAILGMRGSSATKPSRH